MASISVYNLKEIKMTLKITSPNIIFKIAFIFFLFSAQINAQNVLNNGSRRIGDGTVNSINAQGNMEQPFYKSGSDWRKLTYSTLPLDIQWGVGGTGTNNWNINGDLKHNPSVTNPNGSNPSYDYSGLSNGVGVIKWTGEITINNQLFRVQNTYTLGATDGFFRINTKITNISGTNATNVRLWVGTQDDWISTTDSPRKDRGNLVDGVFTAITNNASQAKAIQVSTPQEAIMMFSNSPRAETSISIYDGSFSVPTVDPNSSAISIPYSSTRTTETDGQYVIYSRFNDLANGQSDELDWYYAAGTLSEIQEIVRKVAEAAAGVSNITYTTADYSYTATQSGTTSYVLVAAGSTAPSAAQIKAQADYTGVTVIKSGTTATVANTPNIFNLSGLTHNTNYTLYAVTEYYDAVNYVFTSVITTNFKTLLSPLSPPTISNFNNLNKLFFDDSFTIVPPTTNSAGAFTYTSSNSAVATISGTTVTIHSAGTTIITASQAETGTHTSGTVNASLIVSSVDVLTRKGKNSTLDKIDYMDANGKKGGNRGLTRFGEIKVTKSN